MTSSSNEPISSGVRMAVASSLMNVSTHISPCRNPPPHGHHHEQLHEVVEQLGELLAIIEHATPIVAERGMGDDPVGVGDEGVIEVGSATDAADHRGGLLLTGIRR